MRLSLGLVLLTLMGGLNASAHAQVLLSHLDAKFLWDVPAFTPENAPDAHVLTCGGSVVTVPMPATSIAVKDVVAAPGTYQCDLYAQNSAGRQAAPNVPFPLFQSGYVPGAPFMVQVLPDTPTGGGAVAPTRTGSISSFTNSANSGSTSITIPADATMLIVGVSGYHPTTNYFSGGSMTIGGNAMTAVAADGDTSAFMGTLFYLFNPPTGSQTLAWDWIGTNAPNNGILFAWGAYKDLDTSGIRSSSGTQQAANPHTTGTLTAQSGDLIVAFVEQYASSNATFTWTSATEISEFTNFISADASWAEASPTGNQTVSASSSNDSDGGIMAIVLKPAAGGSASLVVPSNPMAALLVR